MLLTQALIGYVGYGEVTGGDLVLSGALHHRDCSLVLILEGTSQLISAVLWSETLHYERKYLAFLRLAVLLFLSFSWRKVDRPLYFHYYSVDVIIT